MPISRLRAYRTAKGLTLDQVSQRTRIDRAKLSRAERGFARLTADEVRRVARSLRIKLADLRGET